MNDGNASPRNGRLGFLSRTDNPFWWSALIALAPLALSGWQIYDQKISQKQDRIEQEIATDLRSLQVEIANLSTLIYAFVDAGSSDPAVDQKKKGLVLENLTKQQQRVRQMVAFLPAEKRHFADQYQRDLVRARDTIQMVNSKADMQKMWQDMVSLLRSQERMIRVVQERAGLLEGTSSGS